MLLENKNAVVYGAGGAIGAAVARAFASDGASVFLAGRTLAKVDSVAEAIRATGGTAEAAEVDAGDEAAVDRHVADVAAKAGRIDILFNALGMEDIQGTPLIDMSFDDFAQPVLTATRTQFITARAVARHMTEQRAGVIMSVTAEPTMAPDLGGFPAACAVVEALWRGFAVELGQSGIRTVVVRSPGSPDSPGVQAVFGLHTESPDTATEAIQAAWGGTAALGRLPLLADIANAATLLASDRAGAMTATLANVTCGAFLDM
ncbi:MAG TPA: SDR family oxidoreductase [Pseudonocardiaceae bacterium]|jgi:NAD(P)-dependent dehydrogenase (short-subunit alcohol dehydrogenase family)